MMTRRWQNLLISMYVAKYQKIQLCVKKFQIYKHIVKDIRSRVRRVARPVDSIFQGLCHWELLFAPENVSTEVWKSEAVYVIDKVWSLIDDEKVSSMSEVLLKLGLTQERYEAYLGRQRLSWRKSPKNVGSINIIGTYWMQGMRTQIYNIGGRLQLYLLHPVLHW